jgi:hypothetical protein
MLLESRSFAVNLNISDPPRNKPERCALILGGEVGLDVDVGNPCHFPARQVLGKLNFNSVVHAFRQQYLRIRFRRFGLVRQGSLCSTQQQKHDS